MNHRSHNHDKMYVKPTSDTFFRYLFAAEKRRNLLLSFINAVHSDSGFPNIVEVTVTDPHKPREHPMDKESVLDISAKDETGRLYDIEVQTEGAEAFKYRSLYYWARIYTGQIEIAMPYEDLRPAIYIGLLDFPLFGDVAKKRLEFLLKKIEDNDLVLTDHLIMHFLQVRRAEKENVFSKLEKWLAFFRYEGRIEEEDMRVLLNDKDINDAHKAYEHFTQDDELKSAYEAHLKWKLTQGLLRNDAMKKGSSTRAEAIARNLKSMGLTTGQIIEATGLSTEAVEKL